jgi:OmpA-OmpF porin, OOP family
MGLPRSYQEGRLLVYLAVGPVKMRTRRAFVKVAWAVSVLLLGPAASAQSAALSRFDPSERGSRFFVADSLELAGFGQKARFAAGLVSAYALRTRIVGGENQPDNVRLVEHALYLHPGASIAISPGARFGLDVPVAFQGGERANIGGYRYAAPPSPRLGDIRASFDVRLLQHAGFAWAGGVVGHLPTGSPEALTTDDYVRVGLRFAATLRQGMFLFATRAGYMYRREGFVGGASIGSEVNGVIAGGIESGRWFVGPEIWTSTFLQDAFARRTTPVEVLLGGRGTFGDLRVGLAVGSTALRALGAAALRVVLTVEWTKAPAETDDRDRDGVPDAIDPCPDVPGSPGGCPSVPTDRDHDGVLDHEDACPDEPGVRTSAPRTPGCGSRWSAGRARCLSEDRRRGFGRSETKRMSERRRWRRRLGCRGRVPRHARRSLRGHYEEWLPAHTGAGHQVIERISDWITRASCAEKSPHRSDLEIVRVVSTGRRHPPTRVRGRSLGHGKDGRFYTR